MDGKGDSDDAKDMRLKIVQIAKVANQYGHQKNKNVLNLIKNQLRAHARMDDPFDNQPYVYAFTEHNLRPYAPARQRWMVYSRQV